MSTPVHVVCGHCQSVVRVPADKIERSPHCPQCHVGLLETNPFDLTDDGFGKQLQRNDLPLVVDVWAPWCGPCKAMAPQFVAAAQLMGVAARFAKLNSDAAPQTANRLGIRSIPTLIVFHRGRELGRQSGVMDSAALVRWIRSLLLTYQAGPAQSGKTAQ
ncbi:MAG: thioredoxin domain-containing protein [Steroidobacteraceae bacterium]